MALSPETMALIARNRREWEIRDNAANDNASSPVTPEELQRMIDRGELTQEEIDEEYRLYLADPENYGRE